MAGRKCPLPLTLFPWTPVCLPKNLSVHPGVLLSLVYPLHHQNTSKDKVTSHLRRVEVTILRTKGPGRIPCPKYRLPKKTEENPLRRKVIDSLKSLRLRKTSFTKTTVSPSKTRVSRGGAVGGPSGVGTRRRVGTTNHLVGVPQSPN